MVVVDVSTASGKLFRFLVYDHWFKKVGFITCVLLNTVLCDMWMWYQNTNSEVPESYNTGGGR